MGRDDCRECRAGRPHCHGTLVHHPGRYFECTDPDCEHSEVLLHTLSIDCQALGCECAESTASRAAG